MTKMKKVARKLSKDKGVAEEVYGKLKGIRNCSKCGKPLTGVYERVTTLENRYLFKDGKFNAATLDKEDDTRGEMIHDDCDKPLSDEDYEWFLKKVNWHE